MFVKQNRGYNILNLLVILIFTLSLWGCFGGMNPNESKSLLDNPEGEEMTGTPLALSGAVMIPQSAAAAVSASSSQALQVSAIQPSQFVTLVNAPDGTLVQFFNSRFQIVDSGEVKGGQFSITLDTDDYLDPSDPNFVVLYIRTITGSGANAYVQLQAISEPITDEGMTTIGEEVQPSSGQKVVTADVNPTSTVVALSVLSESSVNLMDPSQSTPSMSALSSNNAPSGSQLYYAIRMFSTSSRQMEDYVSEFVSVMSGFYQALSDEEMKDMAKKGVFRDGEGYDDKGDSGGSSNSDNLLISLLMTSFMTGGVVGLSPAAEVKTTMKGDFFILKTCGTILDLDPISGISQEEITRFVYTGVDSEDEKISLACVDKLIDFAGEFLEIGSPPPDNLPKIKSIGLTLARKARRAINNWVSGVNRLYVNMPEMASFGRENLDILALAMIGGTDVIAKEADQVLIVRDTIEELSQYLKGTSLSKREIANVVRDLSRPVMEGTPPVDTLIGVKANLVPQAELTEIDEIGDYLEFDGGGDKEEEGDFRAFEGFDEAKYKAVTPAKDKPFVKKKASEDPSLKKKKDAMRIASKAFFDFWGKHSSEILSHMSGDNGPMSFYTPQNFSTYVMDFTMDFAAILVHNLIAIHGIDSLVDDKDDGGLFYQKIQHFLSTILEQDGFFADDGCQTRCNDTFCYTECPNNGGDKGRTCQSDWHCPLGTYCDVGTGTCQGWCFTGGGVGDGTRDGGEQCGCPADCMNGQCNQDSFTCEFSFCHGSQSESCFTITSSEICNSAYTYDFIWGEHHNCYWDTNLNGCYVWGSQGEYVCADVPQVPSCNPIWIGDRGFSIDGIPVLDLCGSIPNVNQTRCNNTYFADGPSYRDCQWVGESCLPNVSETCAPLNHWEVCSGANLGEGYNCNTVMSEGPCNSSYYLTSGNPHACWWDATAYGGAGGCMHWSQEVCPYVIPYAEGGYCTDGQDNDEDELTDCLDDNCNSDPACQ